MNVLPVRMVHGATRRFDTPKHSTLLESTSHFCLCEHPIHNRSHSNAKESYSIETKWRLRKKHPPPAGFMGANIYVTIIPNRHASHTHPRKLIIVSSPPAPRAQCECPPGPPRRVVAPCNRRVIATPPCNRRVAPV